MTDTEINIAIVEACVGWTDFDNLLADEISGLREWKGRRWHMSRKGDDRWYPLPSYTTDLNAMHEAEKAYEFNINTDGKPAPNAYTYWSNLLNIVSSRGKNENTYCATAAQRAEAFLRTIGKWKE